MADGLIDAPVLNYVLGSTCFKRVVVGCCPDEGGWGFGSKVACVINHRGRLCQELTPDDVEVLGERLRVIDLGESVKFTLHNNACFGDSYFVKSTSIGGTITGPGLVGVTVRGSKAAGKVEHYDAAKLAATNPNDAANNARIAHPIWIGDRELTYQAPKCAKNVKGGERDMWQFGEHPHPNPLASSDDILSRNKIIFRLKPDLLYKIEGTDMVFSTATSMKDGWRISPSEPGCNGSHLHGNHPCTGVADPNSAGCGHGKVVKVGG